MSRKRRGVETAQQVAEVGSVNGAEARVAPPPAGLPPVQNPDELVMQFALGMVVNNLHHMRSSGVSPVVALRAMMQGVGMGATAFGIDLGAEQAVSEISAGRERQRTFQTQQAAPAGSC